MHRFSAVEEYYWAGWYFGTLRDLLSPAKTGIISEFGAQAPPRLHPEDHYPGPSVVAETTAADDPGWVRWKYHNFQPFQTFKFAGIPRGNTIQEMIENTRAYQARLVALAAESYRRQRYQPVTALFTLCLSRHGPPSTGGGGLSAPAEGGYYAPARLSADPAIHRAGDRQLASGQPGDGAPVGD